MRARKGLALWLTLALVFWGGQCALVNSVRQALPEAVEFYPAELSLEQARQALQALCGEAVGWQQGTVSEPVKGETQTVRLAVAGAGYGQLLRLGYTAGGWFAPDAVASARFAVLPQSLALRLFGTADTAGGWIELEGQRYQVCGIYRQSGNFLDGIVQGAEPVIYISRPVGAELSEGQTASFLLPAAMGESGAKLAAQAG